MSYQALYRAYRSTCFAEVVGQDHVIRTLKNQVIQGRISHAYLFCGSRGTGKTSTAKILARAINCADPQDGEPCGRCASCQALAPVSYTHLPRGTNANFAWICSPAPPVL